MKNLVSYVLVAVLVAFGSSCKRDKKEDTTPHDNPFGNVYSQTTPWPKWVFSPWIWEGESTQQSATQIVNDYLAHDIPVGAIIIDSPWETDYNTFEWDRTAFPDPKAMIDYFHSKNVRVFCWITGAIDTNVHPLYDYARDHGYFLQQSANSGPGIVEWWKPVECSLIDFYNPEAVAWWKSLMDKTLAYGIDGWKCDGSDYLMYDIGKGKTYDYSPYLKGKIPSRNDYSDKYYRLFHEYTREKLGNDRVITARPVDNYGFPLTGNLVEFMPKDISFACWVGDQDGDFGGLKAALNNMYESSKSGYLTYGSDIGGYRTDPNYEGFPGALGHSKECFVRWAQMGAMSPIMENGGGGEHRPWKYDTETDSIYRRFAKLRMQMIPYLMKTAELKYAASQGMSSFFNKTDYSYLLGEEMFVAPILADGGNVTVKFPAGSNWVYLFDKTKTFTGGTTQTINYALKDFPVYIKEGSTLLTTLNPTE